MTLAADTHIYIYAIDDRDPVKQAMARDILRALADRGGLVALQVIGELQNALRRRLKMPAHAACQQARNIFVAFPRFGYDARCVETALAHAGAGWLSYWDALLLAASDDAGVETLFSEDMQDGFRLGRVEVVNPFGATALSDRARRVLDA